MRIEAQGLLAIAVFLGAVSLPAQEIPLSNGSVSVKFAEDSPLAASTFTNESRAVARGAAMELNVRVGLVLRNVTPDQYIHGVTLRVVAQEVAVGGAGAVSYPSLHIAPGETFPVRIDMQLMRPTQSANGPLVEINLDGVLFQDLKFYGRDRLNSRRTMTAWELESQRDREYFKQVLAQSGPEGLRKAVLESLTRQAERPRLDARVTRGVAVTSAGAATERDAGFAFLQLPDSPVVPVTGSVRVAGNEARAPRVDVQNRSRKPVRYVELGWVVSDPSGQRYLAASLPASDPELYLPPGRTAKVLQDTAIRFSRDGRPMEIRNMSAFVSQVQYGDGAVWVPNRRDLERAQLLSVVAPSAEEQRLTDLYRKRGINALVDELKRY